MLNEEAILILEGALANLRRERQHITERIQIAEEQIAKLKRGDDSQELLKRCRIEEALFRNRGW